MLDSRQSRTVQTAEGSHDDVGRVWNPLAFEELSKSQRSFFSSGATLDLNFRKKQLLILRELIRSYEKPLAKALQDDLGKSPAESYMTEIGVVLSEIRDTLKHLRTWMRAESRKTPFMFYPARSQVRREPFGRCLIMSPWNYPVLLNLSPLVSALAAGNVAVLKPSELAPHVSQVLRLMISDGFASEVVALIEGDAATSASLLEQRWDMIFFTGSTAVGRIVSEAAAKHLTPCVLELGGKSPCIVSSKANLGLAARRIVWGKFINAGQTCVAPDYVLVTDEMSQPLLKALEAEIQLRFGKDPLQNSELPRIVSEKHFKRLMALIDPTKLAFGGEYDAQSLRIAPTLMAPVSPEDPIMKEEIFGPLLPLIPVKNLEAAKAFVQAREKPLALYLFSDDKDEQEQIAREVSYGGGCMNDVLLHTGNGGLPFGGVGESGMGAYHGKDGFEAFSHRKALFYGSTLVDPPFRYRPWNKLKSQLFRLLLR